MKIKYIMFPALLILLASAYGKGDISLITARSETDATYIQSNDASHFDTYYQPEGGYIGDPMPFFDPVTKDFKIMYLQEYRPNGATFHPFWCLETKDVANYTSLGELIPTGSVSDIDGALGTGSTIYNPADSTYYTYYTGHSVNRHLTGIGEAVMVAKSKDFKKWDKDPSFLLTGEGEYDTNDFRDPCVYKGDNGLYYIIVSTLKDGKGVLAEYSSADLKNWKSVGVFMPMLENRFYECPDLFRIGDWWYLVYSEKHASVRRVQYFKGRTLEELKKCTADGAIIWPDDHEGILDSRAFYAGKTASDGVERYIWGWCPTRPDKDNTKVGAYPAEPSWAGSLVAHRIIQHNDGTLTLGPVKGIDDKYSEPVAVKVMKTLGGASVGDEVYKIDGEGAILFSRLGECNKIEFTLTTDGTEDCFGISMARGIDSECYYSIIVSSIGNSKSRITFEQEGRDGKGIIESMESYVFATPADNRYKIRIFTDNSICVVYINDIVAYTVRIYGLSKNCWSVNSYGGTITINDLKVSGI